jgi:hypothetical protein
VMRMFKLGKRKSIKERKLALINQINSQLHNVGQLDNRDCVYRPVQAVGYTGSSQSSRG